VAANAVAWIFDPKIAFGRNAGAGWMKDEQSDSKQGNGCARTPELHDEGPRRHHVPLDDTLAGDRDRLCCGTSYIYGTGYQ
jgi:hypothetical protein